MIMRKNIATICLLVTMLLMTVSCEPSKLEAIAESLDKECPIPIGSMGYVAGANCSGDDIVITFIIDGAYTNVKNLKNNEDLWRRNTIQSFAWKRTMSEGEIFSDFLKETAEAGGNLNLSLNVMGVTLNETENSATLILSNEDLHSIVDKEPSPLELLKCQIELSNLSLPVTVEEGIRNTEIAIEGDYVVNNLVLDEDLYDIEIFDNNVELKEVLLEGLKLNANNPLMQLILKLLKETGKGVAYRFIGNVSGKEVFIPIEIDEL